MKGIIAEQSDANTTAHSWSVSREQKYHDWTLKLVAKDDYKLVDEEGQGNLFQGVLAADSPVSGGWQWSSSYAISFQELRLKDNLPVTSVEDADGITHAFTLEPRFWLRPKPADASEEGFYIAMGGIFSVIDADGDDVDQLRYRGQVRLVGQPFSKNLKRLHPLAVEADYRFDFADYRNANSKAGSGYQFAREDHLHETNVSLSYPLELNLDWLDKDKVAGPDKPASTKLVLTYHYDQRESNILGQDKDDHRISFGITGTF